jgi:hypothetical protein
MISRRTAASNRSSPTRRVRARSPPSRSSTTRPRSRSPTGTATLRSPDLPARHTPAVRGSAGPGSAHRPAVAHGARRAAAAGPRSHRPAPDVAGQLRGQPSDQHGVFLVGLVEGQVLAAAGPRAEHPLHACERHSGFTGELTEHAATESSNTRSAFGEDRCSAISATTSLCVTLQRASTNCGWTRPSLGSRPN